MVDLRVAKEAGEEAVVVVAAEEEEEDGVVVVTVMEDPRVVLDINSLNLNHLEIQIRVNRLKITLQHGLRTMPSSTTRLLMLSMVDNSFLQDNNPSSSNLFNSHSSQLLNNLRPSTHKLGSQITVKHGQSITDSKECLHRHRWSYNKLQPYRQGQVVTSLHNLLSKLLVTGIEWQYFGRDFYIRLL